MIEFLLIFFAVGLSLIGLLAILVAIMVWKVFFAKPEITEEDMFIDLWEKKDD